MKVCWPNIAGIKTKKGESSSVWELFFDFHPTRVDTFLQRTSVFDSAENFQTFMGCTLGFHQYKNHKLRQTLYTGPPNEELVNGVDIDSLKTLTVMDLFSRIHVLQLTFLDSTLPSEAKITNHPPSRNPTPSPSPSSHWSCTVNSAASSPAPGRCWDRPLARRLTARPASGGWTTHPRGVLSTTWASGPPCEWSPTPVSRCCCRSPSTSSVRPMTPSMWCGAPCVTWGRTARASCTTCCGRRPRTTLTPASTSPRRTGWTTATWSSRRRRGKTGESSLPQVPVCGRWSVFLSDKSTQRSDVHRSPHRDITSTLSVPMGRSLLCAFLVSHLPFHEALSESVAQLSPLRGCTALYTRGFQKEPLKNQLPRSWMSSKCWSLNLSFLRFERKIRN